MQSKKGRKSLGKLLVLAWSILLFLFAYTMAYALAPTDTPPDSIPSWITEQTDCHGEDMQEYNNGNPNPNEGCQSYDTDVYENLEYGSAAQDRSAACVDIERFKISSDDKWVFVHYDMAGPWTTADCSSAYLAIEFDIDAGIEDHRGDYFVGGPVDKCQDNGGNWREGIGGIGWIIYDDANNDVGGATPETGAACGGACDDPQGGQDGYDTDAAPSDQDMWCRTTGSSDIIEIAVRKSAIGLSEDPNNSTSVRVRGWTNQQSTIEKDKLYWHDEHDSSDLGSDRIDNLDWNASVTAVSLQDIEAGKSSGNMVWILVIALVLLSFVTFRLRKGDSA